MSSNPATGQTNRVRHAGSVLFVENRDGKNKTYDASDFYPENKKTKTRDAASPLSRLWELVCKAIEGFDPRESRG